MELITAFENIFHKPPRLLVKAPGRINLIGEHTDYNKGFVLPSAIDCLMHFGLSPKADSNTINIHSLDLKDSIQFSLDDLAKSDKAWANFFIGILLQLQKQNKSLSGFDLVFGGDIPIGAGLSSSSALECGFLIGLSELFDLQLTNAEIIEISHRSNHELLGLQGGIMDHFTILHGKKNQAILLDCENLEYRYIPLDFGDYEIVLFDSKVSHSLVDSAYNDRVAECKQALEIIQKKYPDVAHLSSINDTILAGTREDMPEKIYRRAKFVKEENGRVHDFCKALKIKDYRKLGSLLYESHHGLCHDYEVSCQEMDVLVEIAKSHRQISGARMMGGGFGGCMISLIEKNSVQETTQSILKSYKEKVGLDAELHFVHTSEGAIVIKNVS